VEELTKRIETLVSDGFEKAKTSAQEYSEEIRETTSALDNLSKGIGQSADEFENLAEQNNKAKDMVNRIKDFVGMAGAAKMLQSALRNAC
jgi:methyl-accepting chemotaxis protein